VPQQDDRDARAREYVQSLVQEIDQWTSDFPHQFYLAAAKPPVDSSKLSDSAKASAQDLGDSVKRLSAMVNAKDVLSNAAFKAELDKTIGTGKQLNQAMGSQRFPEKLQTKWEEIRTNLNGLAQVYKLETVAYIGPPAAGRGNGGGKGAAAVLAKLPPGAVAGYIIDQSCALKGKGMWTNVACVQKCLRDGDKMVLITEEGKVYQITNPDKVDSEAYGQKVVVTGKTEADAITVATLQL
jgi:hypothetical protein